MNTERFARHSRRRTPPAYALVRLWTAESAITTLYPQPAAGR